MTLGRKNLTKNTRFLAAAFASCLAVGALATPALAANPGTGTTTDSLPVTVTITSPTDGTELPVGSSVDVTGQVAIGTTGATVNVAYVVDQSGSTSSVGGACGDLNNDGYADEIIDCEILGVQTLNNQLVGKPGVQVGLVPFSSTASIAVPFTSPGDPAVNAALTSLVPGGGTDFDAALTQTVSLYTSASADSRKVAFLFTDGESSLSTGPGSPLADAVAAGIQVNTFAIGEGAAPCEAGQPIQQIADDTGGTCTNVTDPAQLAAVLEGLVPAGLERVEVSIGAGAPVLATVDALGFFSATVSPVVAGPNPIVATAFIDDGTQVSADVTVFGPVPPTTVAPPTTAPTPAAAAAVRTQPRFTG